MNTLQSTEKKEHQRLSCAREKSKNYEFYLAGSGFYGAVRARDRGASRKKKERDSSKYPKSRPLQGKEALVTLAEMSPGSKCVSQSTALLFTLSDKTVSPFFLQRSWLSLLLLSWH